MAGCMYNFESEPAARVNAIAVVQRSIDRGRSANENMKAGNGALA